MEDGVNGVNGANAPFHVELGNIPELVFVTILNKKIKASIALVMLPKQDLVTMTLVQVSKFYT